MQLRTWSGGSVIQYDKGDNAFLYGLGYVAECAWSSAGLEAPSTDPCL